MAMERVPGFTKAQREWIKERDGHRCCFMTYDASNNKWTRCQNRGNLQVHHITPRGFYSFHLHGCGWDVNSPENGITLCSFHHVGDGARNIDKPFVIHWDIKLARRYYRGQGPNNSFDRMRARRVELNQKYGRPYWNTRWDWLFRLLVELRNKEFDRPYPANRNPAYMKNRTKGTISTIEDSF